MDVTFDQAVIGLNRYRQADYEDVSSYLQTLCNKMKIVHAGRDLGLDKAQSVKTLIAIFDFDQYVENILDEIMKLVPIDEESLEMSRLEGEPLTLCPLPQGGNIWSFEEFIEIIESISESPQYEDESLMFFLKMLNLGPFGDGVWAGVAEYFEWPIIDPPACLSKGESLNEIKLESLLEDRGLEYFWGAFDVALGISGNPFFLYNRYDFDGEELFEFNAEEITRLAKKWDEAQTSLLDYEIAKQVVSENPAILHDILKVWEDCLC